MEGPEVENTFESKMPQTLLNEDSDDGEDEGGVQTGIDWLQQLPRTPIFTAY